MTTTERLAAALNDAHEYGSEGWFGENEESGECGFWIPMQYWENLMSDLAAYEADQKQEASPSARQEALEWLANIKRWISSGQTNSSWRESDDKIEKTIKAALTTDQSNVSEDVRDYVETSKLKEAFGMFLNGMAYYETFPDNEEDAKQLRKSATYNFLRARNHISEELEDICSASCKAVYVEEYERAATGKDLK